MSIYMPMPPAEPTPDPSDPGAPEPTDRRSLGQRTVAAALGVVFMVGLVAVTALGLHSIWNLFRAGDRALIEEVRRVGPGAAGAEQTDGVDGRSMPFESIGTDALDASGSLAGAQSGDERGLVWSTMAVPLTETLPVRSQPARGANIVGSLDPPARGLTMTGTARRHGGELWREIRLSDSTLGWVPARHVTAQPAAWNAHQQGDDLVDLTRGLWAFLTDARGDSQAQAKVPRLASTGVWFGGLGIMGQVPTPLVHLDAPDLRNPSGWLDRHDFSPNPAMAQFCGGGCLASPRAFLNMPAWDRPGVRLLLDDLDRAVTKSHGHVDPMAAMHSVTIDVPATGTDTLDWQRIHVWFDWSEGEPAIVGLYTWSWTP